MWNGSDWSRPTAYLGPYRGPAKSDVLLHLAFIRAARDGNFVPFRSKIIPELGAPENTHWDDWPITEEFPIFGMGLLAREFGIFAALNFTILFCHLLAGLSFYFAARYRGGRILWAFLFALAFGLAPFLFSESPDHVFVALCWHVPLFVIVWDWISTHEGLDVCSRKFWGGIAVGFMAGLQMPYYTAIFCLILLLGALTNFIQTQRGKVFFVPFCFIGAALAAFALMNLDTWIARFRFGPNPQALVRPYQWLEIYGLKLADLLTSPWNHHWSAFRNFADWRVANQILHDEGSYFGIIGICALILLVAVALYGLSKSDLRSVPRGFWQALWIFIFFTTGGLNPIAGLFGFTFLRSGCRFSIVILAIALLFAAEYLSRIKISRALILASVLVGSIILLLDQVPIARSAAQKDAIATQVSSDENFVRDIESVLPAGALVFQLPVMDFPESPLRTLSGYDHLRPYLYSRQLRFSFGSMKGRPAAQWQREVEKLSLADSISELKKRGFVALYVNRIGYPDGARALEQDLRGLGYDKEIESTTGDLFCVQLE